MGGEMIASDAAQAVMMSSVRKRFKPDSKVGLFS